MSDYGTTGNFTMEGETSQLASEVDDFPISQPFKKTQNPCPATGKIKLFFKV